MTTLTPKQIATQLDDMKSGECRYIGEKWVHVYCHAPLVEKHDPLFDRMKWEKGPRWFRVVCSGVFDVTARELFDKTGNGRWLEQEETIDRVLVALAAPMPAPRPPVPYGQGLTMWEQMRDLYPVAKGL